MASLSADAAADGQKVFPNVIPTERRERRGREKRAAHFSFFFLIFRR